MIAADRRHSTLAASPFGALERRRRVQARAFRGDRRYATRSLGFSRSTRKTTWARAARRIAASTRSASSIRSRCTGSASRSARPGRSTAPICNGSPRVARRFEPALVSEHLAWSTHEGAFLNDLLPLPYTGETLARVSEHVDEVQNALGRRMLLENPSTYVVFAESTWAETDFLREIARRTGCGLLLDVSNVFVSAVNHGFDPEPLSRRFPAFRGRRNPPRGLCRGHRRRRPAAPHRRAQFAGPRSRVGALRRGDPAPRSDADADRMGQRRARVAGASRRGAPGRARDRCLRGRSPERADAV